MKVIHAETTENLIGSDWDTSGQVTVGDNYVRYSYTQGTASQTIDLSAYDNIEQLTYGAEFIGCNNYIGGHCGSTNPNYYDQVTVQLTVNGQTYTNVVTTDYNVGWMSKEWTVDLNQSPTEATLSFTSYDPGFWAGNYGAIVMDAYVTATYSVAQLASIGVLDNVISQPAHELPNILPSEPVLEPIQPLSPESSMMAQVDVKTAENTPETRTESTNEERQQETVETKTEIKAKVAVSDKKISAGKIAAQIGDAYNPAAQAVMMSLMQSARIQQPSLIDVAFYTDKGLRDKSINDRFWLDLLVSDVKWQKMVDSEWQR